ncbi:MAG: HAD hydrolase family protein, partial [Candidatus Levyibacteriota bacterium]
PRVQSAIQRWIAFGNHFSICTGKQYRHIQHAIDALQLTDPQIVRGGGEIIDPKSGKVIYAAFINPSELMKLVSLLDESLIPFSAEQDDIFYTQNAIPLNKFPGIKYKKIEDIPFDKITKVVLWTDDIPESRINRFITEYITDKFRTIELARSYSPGSKSWQITSIDGTKFAATQRISQMIGVPKNRLIGIGDSHNDIPLFNAVGYKVAMGNGAEELKEMANLLVPPYTEDGVAIAIEKLIGN